MPRLARMFESAWNRTEPARPMDYASRDAVDLLNDDHERMLHAFRARDAAALLEVSRDVRRAGVPADAARPRGSVRRA